MNTIPTAALVALATTTVALIATWPRTTSAQEVADWERQGEWDDDGMRFGNIVIKGELVADAAVPGGWVVVRTYENKGDVRDTCTVEERVLRTETMPDARVEPPPFAVVDRMQTFALGPHEKRSIGVTLSRSIGDQITAEAKKRAAIEQGRAGEIVTGKFTLGVMQRTYFRFQVDYLKPLPPGATAAPPPEGVTHPETMPF